MTNYAVFDTCVIERTKRGGAILIDTLSSARIEHTTFDNIKSRSGACIAGYMDEKDSKYVDNFINNLN